MSVCSFLKPGLSVVDMVSGAYRLDRHTFKLHICIGATKQCADRECPGCKSREVLVQYIEHSVLEKSLTSHLIRAFRPLQSVVILLRGPVTTVLRVLHLDLKWIRVS